MKKIISFSLLLLLNNLYSQSYVNKNLSERIYIFKSDSLNKRVDQSSVITLDNGNIAVAYSRFGSNSLDTGSSSIYMSISSDGGYNWNEGSELISSISLGSYIPSLYRKLNGNIICVFFVRETASPSYSSTLRQIEFDGNMENIIVPLKTIYTGGYNPIASDRLFYDKDNGLLLMPFPKLISGKGTSAVSVYEGGLLISQDEGNTWIDTGLLLTGELDLNGFGGCMEPGIFSAFNNLGYYCRTTTGSIQYSKLRYTGIFPAYYSYSPFINIGIEAQNAQSTIKYIDTIDSFTASYTNVNVSDPLNWDRQSMGVSISYNALNWDIKYFLDDVSNTNDYQINSVNIYEDKIKNNLLFFYSIAPTSGFYDFICKIIPLSSLENIETLSLENIKLINRDLSIYPNPSASFIQVSGIVEKEDYRIFDYLGREIKQGSISNEEKIEIKTFSHGVYLFKINNNMLKFIKN